MVFRKSTVCHISFFFSSLLFLWHCLDGFGVFGEEHILADSIHSCLFIFYTTIVYAFSLFGIFYLIYTYISIFCSSWYSSFVLRFYWTAPDMMHLRLDLSRRKEIRGNWWKNDMMLKFYGS